jgi:alpha-mannosidase
MRMSLLRSPTRPDPEADQGEHRFTYSLLPHSGSWDETTIGAAYALNDPLIVADLRGLHAGVEHTNTDQSFTSLIVIDRPNIVVETVKRAEDGRGIIVRCYESQRRRGPVSIRPGFPVAEAWRTNLLEEDQRHIEVLDGGITYSVRPYEIFTLRLVPAT